MNQEYNLRSSKYQPTTINTGYSIQELQSCYYQNAPQTVTLYFISVRLSSG